MHKIFQCLMFLIARSRNMWGTNQVVQRLQRDEVGLFIMFSLNLHHLKLKHVKSQANPWVLPSLLSVNNYKSFIRVNIQNIADHYHKET